MTITIKMLYCYTPDGATSVHSWYS